MAHLWHIKAHQGTSRNVIPPVVVGVGLAALTSAQVKRLRSRSGPLGGTACGTSVAQARVESTRNPNCGQGQIRIEDLPCAAPRYDVGTKSGGVTRDSPGRPEWSLTTSMPQVRSIERKAARVPMLLGCSRRGRAVDRDHRGSYMVIELRYVGQQWESTGNVHVELCETESEDKFWANREVDTCFESHATSLVPTKRKGGLDSRRCHRGHSPRSQRRARSPAPPSSQPTALGSLTEPNNCCPAHSLRTASRVPPGPGR